jgi:hypothetical protein
MGHSGLDLLTLSSSHFDPKRLASVNWATCSLLGGARVSGAGGITSGLGCSTYVEFVPSFSLADRPVPAIGPHGSSRWTGSSIALCTITTLAVGSTQTYRPLYPNNANCRLSPGNSHKR